MTAIGFVHKTVDQLLAAARADLRRVTALEADAALGAGAVLVDIRCESKRSNDGVVPGSCHVARNVFEWRLDPASPHRDPELAQVGKEIIVICDAGYQSSFAAATARQFGVDATDVVGGFQAWRAGGLPVRRCSPVAGGSRTPL